MSPASEINQLIFQKKLMVLLLLFAKLVLQLELMGVSGGGVDGFISGKNVSLLLKLEDSQGRNKVSNKS